MRAKNREINIVNMSLLDILSGALGVFLFLMLALIPAYYSKSTNSDELRKKLKEATKFLVIGARWQDKNAAVELWLSENGVWHGPTDQFSRSATTGSKIFNSALGKSPEDGAYISGEDAYGSFVLCYRLRKDPAAAPQRLSGAIFRRDEVAKGMTAPLPVRTVYPGDSCRLWAIFDSTAADGRGILTADELSPDQIEAMEKAIASEEGIAYRPPIVEPAPGTASCPEPQNPSPQNAQRLSTPQSPASQNTSSPGTQAPQAPDKQDKAWWNRLADYFRSLL